MPFDRLSGYGRNPGPRSEVTSECGEGNEQEDGMLLEITPVEWVIGRI